MDEVRRDRTITIKHYTYEQCIEAIKKYYGDVPIYTHFFSMDDLMCFFVEPPDKYYQNYVGQAGKAAFVLDIPESYVDEMEGE